MNTHEIMEITNHGLGVTYPVLEQKSDLLTQVKEPESRKYESPGPQIDKDGHVRFYMGSPVRFNQRGN